MSLSDPIRKDYYEAVQKAEGVLDALFYLNAALSIAALLVDQKLFPDVYDAVLLLFSVSVVAMLTLSLVLRLHLTPRAEDKRRQDFFGSACNVSLTPQQTDGYYNNEFKEPVKRMAAQVLENSLFSQAIASRMARQQRVKAIVYLLAWLLLLHYRRTELSWIVVASQVVFSEQILSKWCRLEWLRGRFEKTFEDVYRLFQTQPPVAHFKAHALNAVTMYESSKASAGITLSSKIFDELNPSLSVKWETIKATLKI